MGDSSSNRPLGAIMYMVHHIFLPPKLPQKDDFDPRHERVLLNTISNALQMFKGVAEYGLQEIIESVSAMMDNLRIVHDESGAINQRKLEIALRKLSQSGGVIPLHLKAQNAGVIISKVSPDICFEAFELSPRNESVITTKGRLRRSFPGSAFAVSQITFDEDGFQVTLAQTIAKMSHRAAPDMQPKVRKAGQQHNEDRDTTHPNLVTEHLMSFLRAAGKPAELSTIWKNTREEVMWLNSLLPWRRSPLWLLVRVAIQLGFSRSAIPTTPPKDLYKAFMVFFLAHILELSHAHALQSDTLSAMNAKLSRRLLKLGVEQAKPWVDVVRRVMSMTHSLVDKRWQDIINRTCPSPDLLPLNSIKFKDDVTIYLPDLDDYIVDMAGREMKTSSSAFQPTSALPNYPPDDLPPSLGAFTGDYKTFGLAAFECWVASALPRWLDGHISHATTCGLLRNLIENYHSSAASHYANNPEGSSIMLLTILELWVACDKSACILYELLPDYDPKIPVELLQSLLLPFKGQMKRLADAEQYLKSRHGNVKVDSPPIFRSFGHPSAFSARYFNQSSEHQTLLSRIEAWASREREKKCRELSEKKEEYWTLMRLHDQSDCEYYEVIVNEFDDFRETRHSSSCKKCRYQHDAVSISIGVNEWPLPSSQIEAKSTVFELMVPAAFSGWRDATTYFLNDVLGCDYSERECPRAKHTLQNYRGLSSFFNGSSLHPQRVGLLSQVKPHISTHRRNKSIADTTEGDVCLNNGLRYQYHDCDKDVFTSAFCATDRVLELCTYRLPERSSSLQKFLARPPSMPSGLPPNRVIASQSDCPGHISLDEFKAFTTLPLGYRIQWMNILNQLSTPSLDFTKVETNILLLQTIYQAGPPSEGNIGRASHEVLADETFDRAFLIQLQGALQRLKENWESSRALASFIHLASRLLSLTSSIEIQNTCLKYLAKAREVAFGWVNLLQDKAQHSTDQPQRTEFLSRAVEVALVCVNTFDVDQTYLDDILASPPDASVLIQCSITVQEHSRSTLGQRDPLQCLMLERWKNLSYRAIHMLTREVVEIGSLCLDDAIKKSWSDYQAGSSWQPVASPYEHWLSSKTPSQLDLGPLSVHFNLLTAELLVNGLPLTLLPSNYRCHPTYTTLFGLSNVEVMPTRVPGMQFSGKKAYAGYTIHFGMQSILGRRGLSGSDLLLHAMQNGRKYDLLPSRIFDGKFPVAFVDQFAHWYDHAGNSIEFRPIENPWSSSPANWRLTKVGSSWRLTRDGVALVSISSNTARALSGILFGLEEPLHIHTFFHETSGSLEIELLRLQLGFNLKTGTSLIHSREFRGMSIDPNQVIDTLVGLRNKLVLKQDNGCHDRLVVIPEGRVTYERTSGHLVVSIDRNGAAKAHPYYIDKRLGRIVDNGNLQSKLFLCYLHGLTSYCLPDPLTQRSGTEQALSILTSAAVRSFDCLTEENLAILERIVKLAPGRSYYPANERVMQKVDWDSNLSFLSQHNSFYTYVKDIFVQANDQKILHTHSYIEPPHLEFVNTHLLERDLIRSSAFRVSDFGAEQHTVEHDAEYFPRDHSQNSERATCTFVTASLIFQRRAVLHVDVLSDFRASLWERLKRHGTIEGPNLTLDNSLLTFDSKWLEVPSNPLYNLWCRVHTSLSHSPHDHNNFRIAMWLSTVAFAKNADMQIIQTLAAFYNMPDFAQISAPPVTLFNLSKGAKADLSELGQLLRRARRPFHNCPEASLPRKVRESERDAQKRRQRQFQSNQDRAIKSFASALEGQWPCEVPQTPVESTFSIYLNTGQAMNEVRLKFKTWFENYRFYEYLGRIEDALRRQVVDPIAAPSYVFSVPKSGVQERCRHVSIDDIFAGPAPSVFPEAPTSLNTLVRTDSGETHTSPRLDALLAGLEAQVNTKYERDYIKHLRDSLLSLQGRTKKSLLDSPSCDIAQVLEHYLADCDQHVRGLYSSMMALFGGESQTTHAMAATVRQWPRVCPAFFLHQLTLQRWKRLSDAWKECIIKYGLALTELQRAERLLSLFGNPINLTDELLNIGHRNWKPSEFPESLLLEVESGIMIREVQEEIARQMRKPQSNENAVMQLNMGEGKSSVIVPIVAAALADGTRLVRVIVAKPQSKQMFQMLVSKLGGLLGRRIYHMPFSRAVRLQVSQADTIGRTYRECMVNRGILLVQPEQILSFKLMGLECLATGHESIGRSLLKTQHFFDTQSRDIVDESDENFSVKFELIYTIGIQGPIELSPERWTIIQTLLGLVARFALDVKADLPLSVNVDDRWLGRYPRIRILRPDAHELILKRIADHICTIGFSGFPVARQPEEVRQVVCKYITKPDLTTEEIAQVESEGKACFWTDSTRNPLLLIRGLIAGGVLSFAFGSKRWRVNYGLDPNRLPKTKLAVPFRAKDNPTPRSEFSHPDVVIVLTSLSYYYGGLEDDDLFITFSHLLKSDQAEVEYLEWVRTAPDLPDAFRQLVGINIKDRFQCVDQVFPPLRYSKGVIDYFLSHIVFPKEMKEFPHKISASGWDIGQIKSHPTTGFSGTNDSRHVLPLSVQHLDLPEQKHTNALVLECLLQDENSVELLPQGDKSTGSDAELLIATVIKMDPAVRVILDVGAQILELSNLQVAEEWLNKKTDQGQTEAVVFFNDRDELSVLDRKGRIELLQTSPFAKQLDVCLVFLDEAHTRGTDLRLPNGYRAAVTMGANLTKDRLVQACMRMRKLGKGQSVVFCVPEEIKTKILQRTPKRDDATIKVADVLSWAISETCVDLRRSMPLWAAQGRRFEDQKILWAAGQSKDGLSFPEGHAKKFLEVEAQTLDHRYRPHAASITPQLSGWDVQNENINRIIGRCLEFESLNFNSATFQEEQERELSPEIEQERQIERPAPAEPETHRIHYHVETFVRTGTLVADSEAFMPAFEALRSSSAAAHLDVSQFPQDLLVTVDFVRTVKTSGRTYVSDAYHRPVQWILSSTGAECSSTVKHMVIISPFEAQELLPPINKCRKVTLHIYAPRPNLGFRPLDALDLFTQGKPLDSHSVPRHLIIQLNLFAGQLYMSSFKEYTEICDFLGLAWKAAEEGVLVRTDGFIVPAPGKKGFKDSPVQFLKVLTTKIRRNCEGIEKTHLGKMLHGALLEEADFDV